MENDPHQLPIVTTTRSPQQPRVMISLGRLIIVVGILLALAGGAGWFFWQKTMSEKAQLERKMLELEQQKREAAVAQQKQEEDAQLAAAQIRQQEALVQAKSTVLKLEDLNRSLTSLLTDTSALRNNDLGKTIAADLDLVQRARRLYDDLLPEVPKPDELTEKLQSVRRVALKIEQGSGTKYIPGVDLTSVVQDAVAWVSSNERPIKRARSTYDALLEDSKVRATVAGTMTLNEAMRDFATLEARKRDAEIARQVKAAKEEGNKKLADEIAKREAAELERRRVLAENDTKTIKTTTDIAKATAAADDERRRREAAEAEKKAQLVAKAKNPEVQQKLAAFITPGYWIPNFNNLTTTSYQKEPVSFKTLQQLGVLAPANLPKLAVIATHDKDKVRPRWGRPIPVGNTIQFKKNTAMIEQAQEAQDLLNELGPTLVELGLLKP